MKKLPLVTHVIQDSDLIMKEISVLNALQIIVKNVNGSILRLSNA